MNLVQTKTDDRDIIKKSHLSLISKVKEYIDSETVKKIEEAFHLAKKHHENQKRQTGEPYVVHPIEVAKIITEYKLDGTSIIVSLLHDTVEDTNVKLDEIKTLFGSTVASIVDGLTKISKVEFRSNQEKMAENFRKMILAMSKDIRVIIIKLADRIHNMRTIYALNEQKKQRISHETLDIYAPLAGRLGMYRIKSELEDLCLKTLKPSVYSNLVEKLAQKKSLREKNVNTYKVELESLLKKNKVNAKLFGRAKNLYSIYKKMNSKKLEFKDIYDLFGLRVLVQTIPECYEALGLIHNRYRPVSRRFKDYIAMPKDNLYQSLHTTIISDTGELLEIQIRTEKMDEIAEYGIAAHWKYKENPLSKDKFDGKISQDSKRFNWLRQIISLQKELKDPNEFLEAVKVDLFDEEVYVFSPKGDIFNLRKGATCLDFAFAIHSELGLRTTGAKVNGRLMPIRTKLKNGDMVEILHGQKIHATKDWLNYAITTKSRNKIRIWLRAEELQQAKINGFESLDSELHKYDTSFDKMTKLLTNKQIQNLFHQGSLDELIAQIGYGKINAQNVAEKILAVTLQKPKTDELHNFSSLKEGSELNPDLKKVITKNRQHKKDNKSVIIVQGMDNIAVKIARCCEPLPGQNIIGYVSRLRGIIVHAIYCKWAISNDPSRRVECAWNRGAYNETNVKFRLITHDKSGVLALITKLFSNLNLNITNMECHTTLQNRAIIMLKFEVSDINQLKNMQQKLEGLDSIIHVERLTG